MTTVETSVDFDVPLRSAYNQSTQFGSFPRFMEGIEDVRQLDDATVRFRGDVGGDEREWAARIVEQGPDSVIAWHGVPGARTGGTVSFREIGPCQTRVDLNMEFEPDDFAEKAGSALGVLQARVKGDMKRFKESIESRGMAEGGWRGESKGGGRTR